MSPTASGPLTRRITVRELEDAVAIEVDGVLDAVTAHDLRRAFGKVLGTAVPLINLDLSRVTAAEDHGTAALAWCGDQAVEARRTLMWTSCSPSLRRALEIVHERTRAHTARGCQPRAV